MQPNSSGTTPRQPPTSPSTAFRSPTLPASCSPRAAQKLAASRPEDGETRAKLIGAIEGRIFTVVFTRRGGLIRLISARRANAQETRAYGPL